MQCIVRRGNDYFDARAELVEIRRVLTNDLNLRSELKRSLKDDDSAFVDTQHFYNAMTFAIQAFEEAYHSTNIGLN